MPVVSSCNLPIKSLYDDIFQHPSTIYCVTEGVERSSGVISMNIITSAGSAAAAVATQVRGEKRAANIVTRPGTLTVWGGGNWGRQGRWRGYTGTLDRVPGPVRTCQLSPRYIESNNSN